MGAVASQHYSSQSTFGRSSPSAAWRIAVSVVGAFVWREHSVGVGGCALEGVNGLGSGLPEQAAWRDIPSSTARITLIRKSSDKGGWLSELAFLPSTQCKSELHSNGTASRLGRRRCSDASSGEKPRRRGTPMCTCYNGGQPYRQLIGVKGSWRCSISFCNSSA